jgi:hypothetical protein
MDPSSFPRYKKEIKLFCIAGVQRNLILARKLEAKYSRAVLHRKNSHWVDKIRSQLEILNNL